MEKLKYLNENLLLAQKKKDEVLALALDENRKLREELEALRNLLKARNLAFADLQKNLPPSGIAKAPSPKPPPAPRRRGLGSVSTAQLKRTQSIGQKTGVGSGSGLMASRSEGILDLGRE